MATVTGDIAIDFTGVSDVNPYTNPDLVNFGEGLAVSGGVAGQAAYPGGGFITSDIPSGNVITSKAEIVSVSGDIGGPVILDASFNGYFLRVFYDVIQIYTMVAGAEGSRIGASLAGQGLVTGDQVELSVNPGTGEITSYFNGVQLEQITDTTYDTGLRAGFAHFRTDKGEGGANSWAASGYATTPTIRKGSALDIETILSGTVTAATLNSVDVSDHITGQVGTMVSFAGAATDEITTSGEYTLALGDGTGTENITVQVNVVGLASFNINKDGADQGSLTDVEFLIITGAEGSRVISDQIINVTTTAGGDTGAIEITDTSLNDGDTVMVAQRSDTVSGGGGAFHPATLGLI